MFDVVLDAVVDAAAVPKPKVNPPDDAALVVPKRGVVAVMAVMAALLVFILVPVVVATPPNPLVPLPAVLVLPK